MSIRKIMALIADVSGTTAIEYGLMAAFVAIASIAGLMASGETLSVIFDAVAGNMAAATASMN
jgi:pilus assembly protein Flp/PilA